MATTGRSSARAQRTPCSVPAGHPDSTVTEETRMIRHFRREQPAEPETPTAEAQDAETADGVRQQAQEQRATAAEARTRAEILVATAQQEAARIVAEAQATAQRLTREATASDRVATKLEERFTYLRHNEQLATVDIPEVERQVDQLVAEAEELSRRAEQLTQRLVELGEQREAIGVQLSNARDSGQVDAVVQLRNQMAGVAEVIAALQGRQQAAQRRLGAIGDAEDGVGELARAARKLSGLQATLRRNENWLYPDRPEAVADAFMEDFRHVIAGTAERLRRDTAPKPNTITFIPTGR